MYEIIGKCSICGGDVEAFVGPWFGTHPPRARCTSCGAVEATSTNVIPMVPATSKDDKTEREYDRWYMGQDLKKSNSDFEDLFSFKSFIQEFSESFKWFKK